MKDYRRKYPELALCGLHCVLCPIHLMENGCPGCGGGEGHQGCAVIRCSREHGAREFCFECDAFPCGRYDTLTAYDSFVPHRDMVRNLETARRIGPEAYRELLRQKAALLHTLLGRYNDGRRKSFFCRAADLLELGDVRDLTERLAAETEGMGPKERGALAQRRFEERAAARGVDLKLRRKPKAQD